MLRLKILVPPAEFSPAGDIVDAVKEFGWERQRILQFVETAIAYSEPAPKSSSAPPEEPSAPTVEKAGYFPFKLSNDAIWFIKEDKDGSKVPIRLASRVDVVAKTRDGVGENWGRLLRWRDHEGRQHQWAMPMEALAAEQGAVRARLL